MKKKSEAIFNLQNEYTNLGWFKRLVSWKYIFRDIISEVESIETIDSEENVRIENIEETNKELEVLRLSAEKDKEKLEQEIKILRAEKDSIISSKATIEAQLKNSNENIEKYTERLFDIFNRTSGNRGKIAEIRLEEIMRQYFGPEGDYWIKNLKVGSTQDIVEFAVRITPDDKKWVPVDSKALIPNKDDETKEFIIDDSYLKSIINESKKITKYIRKSNTAEYALLVLPSDDVFMDIHENNPKIFSESASLGIYITSPNNFTQFINTISQLTEKLEKANKADKIISEIDIVLKHMTSFHKGVEESLTKMNTAFDKHLPNSKKKLDAIKNNELTLISSEE